MSWPREEQPIALKHKEMEIRKKKKKKKTLLPAKAQEKRKAALGTEPFWLCLPYSRQTTQKNPYLSLLTRHCGNYETATSNIATQHWHRPSRGCSVPPPPSAPGAVGIKRLNPIHQCHSATAAEEAKPSPPHLIAHFALHEYKQRQHPSSIPIRLYKDCGRSPVHNPHPALREHQ